ncbi:MAG: glycosyltransferase family 1 protein [Acidobacteriota bacterium]
MTASGPLHERLRTLTPLEFHLPAEFSRLRELAYNLWWSWTPEAKLLFSSVHPELWARTRNPVELLAHVEPHHWESLLVSEAFQAAYERVIGAFDRYMSRPETWWFWRTHPGYDVGPFAYVSTEYGIHETLGIYSGGLGVLSGDHCKAASDLGLPFVAVGLLYRRGYFRQTIDAEGRQQHFYPDFDLTRLPVRPVLAETGRPLVVGVPLLDRTVHLQVHLCQVGRVPVLLLDSDLPQNEVQDRPITHILYVRGREMRFCQEMVLGAGAVRALRALGIAPAVWHLNEGHCAMMTLELLAEQLAAGEPLERAQEKIARRIAFTTHTPVPAGNETFDPEIARLYLGSWAVRLGVPLADLLGLGRIEPANDGEPFNLTVLALRMSSWRNGVSRKHGEVSREMWRPLFPGQEPPITSITNGVHVRTWLGLEMADLFDRHAGPDWEETARDPEAWAQAVERIPDEDLWTAHRAQKRRLVRMARENLVRMYARHGASPRALHAVGGVLDPHALTIGFARRVALYKRAGLLFTDLARLRSILSHAKGPVQFLFAGKAHPADLPGQDLIAQIFRLAQDDAFRGRIVFLEDYDMMIGRLMVQGVDVWLNNPRRPLEASGTSGQKAAINGGLNCSVLDGWWLEGYSPEVGFAIGRPEVLDDQAAQDAEDAESLYAVLENEIVPLYYERDGDGLPRQWIARMRASIARLTPRFCAARMVREYCESAYLPLGLGRSATFPPAHQSE